MYMCIDDAVKEYEQTFNKLKVITQFTDFVRRERQQLEKEKLEAQRLEKLRQEQLERERLEREREEKRKIEQLR